MLFGKELLSLFPRRIIKLSRMKKYIILPLVLLICACGKNTEKENTKDSEPTDKPFMLEGIMPSMQMLEVFFSGDVLFGEGLIQQKVDGKWLLTSQLNVGDRGGEMTYDWLYTSKGQLWHVCNSDPECEVPNAQSYSITHEDGFIAFVPTTGNDITYYPIVLGDELFIYTATMVYKLTKSDNQMYLAELLEKLQ